MTKSMSMPVAAAIVVVIVGIVGFFLYNHFMASPAPLTSGPHAAGMSTLRKPASQEEMKKIGESMMNGKGAH